MKILKLDITPDKPVYTAYVYEHGVCILEIQNFQLGGPSFNDRQKHPEWYVGMINGCTPVPLFGVMSVFYPYLKRSVFLEISEYDPDKKEFTLILPPTTKLDHCIDEITGRLKHR